MGRTNRIPAAVVAVCLAFPALAQTKDAPELASATRGDWVSLTGSVKSNSRDSFVVDYGVGEITVEMDDRDWSSDNRLSRGDSVTVTGRVDKDFYATRTIEASSVYVDRLSTYYYASPADEEGANYAFLTRRNGDGGEWISMTGAVLSKSAESLTIDVGARGLKVDISELARASTAKVGDRVSVSGELRRADPLETRQLVASSVVVLSAPPERVVDPG